MIYSFSGHNLLSSSTFPAWRGESSKPSMPKSRANDLPEDCFSRVAHADIKPTNSNAYIVHAEILPKGQIVQQGLNGYQPLGQIDAQGNFRLVNGQSGNIFRDSDTVSIEPLDGLESAFVQTLKQVERQRSLTGSEIPLIRQHLTSHGINGQGIKIGLLDPRDKSWAGQAEVSDHSKVVMQIIQDPMWGVAPGAQVENNIEPNEKTRNESFDDYQDNINELTEFAATSFARTAHQIQNLLAQGTPDLRILSLTHGPSRSSMYMDQWKKLNDKNSNGYYKFPALRSQILDFSTDGTPRQQFQALVNWMDPILDHNPTIQLAHRQYIEATRQAAEKGIITVVACGNENNSLPFDIPLIKAGADFNELAKSPYVISVAAANTNQSPGQRALYTIAPFSSHGDGNTWNPTIAAPGMEMGISFPSGPFGHNYVVEGTSYATPFTCGVIAMMLQQKPWLGFEQVKARLQSTATRLPHVSTAMQGAGIVNPELAV